MVLLTNLLRYVKDTEFVRKRFKERFIDTLRLAVKGGAGGGGYPKFGGIGGNGGNVYISAKQGTTMKEVLQKYKVKKVTAAHGHNSHRNCILGRRGDDKIIRVPPGVIVFDQRKRCLGEINQEGESDILVARGGLGGRLENGYGGMKGESQVITLELRLIADVGFVGFPNAGKSTLLAALSRAKPKIASYPFTTIKPNIGVMEFEDQRQISLADLPGLIEGAHVNIGMGHRFLRHVERTRLLLLVVDIEGFQLSPKHVARSCLENIILLNKELELFSEELLFKPAILVINKMDKASANEIYDDIKEKVHNLAGCVKMFPEEMRSRNILHFESVLPISAKMGGIKDITKVKNKIRDVIDDFYGVIDVDDEVKLAENLTTNVKEQAHMVT